MDISSCVCACVPWWSPADMMEKISKGENITKLSTYLLNPQDGLQTGRRQACMMATQVGLRAYLAAVAVNVREVVRWCTHHHARPVGVVNVQEGWRDGEVEHRTP